jgi:hypothetical protein
LGVAREIVGEYGPGNASKVFGMGKAVAKRTWTGIKSECRAHVQADQCDVVSEAGDGGETMDFLI